MDPESRLVVASGRGQRAGKWVEVVRRDRLPVMNPRALGCRAEPVTTAKNTHAQAEAAAERGLKASSRENNCDHMRCWALTRFTGRAFHSTHKYQTIVWRT